MRYFPISTVPAGSPIIDESVRAAPAPVNDGDASLRRRYPKELQALAWLHLSRAIGRIQRSDGRGQPRAPTTPRREVGMGALKLPPTAHARPASSSHAPCRSTPLGASARSSVHTSVARSQRNFRPALPTTSTPDAPHE